MSQSVYDQISRNKRRSVLLVLLLVGALTALIYLFAVIYTDSPLAMAGFGLVLVGGYGLLSYYFSDRMVLGISGARKIDKQSALELFRLVENLCIGAGLPMPAIYIIDDTAPNAFATGRDPQHAAVAFTTGILAKLDKQELEGVVAHELSHIKNYDTRFISLVVMLVGVVALVSDLILRLTFFSHNDNNRGNAWLGLVGLLLALLAPLVATIIRMAVSRQREFLADASAAYLTRYPEGLASALSKISADPEPLEVANNATASLYIANPLKGEAANWMSGLFQTHPPTEERIKRLRQM